jgi:branched-chain amino acid transport system permease protein
MIIQQIISGIVLGSIYALIALGFVLIYKSTRIINFAQGDLMMMGAYLCFTFITYTQLNFFLALALATLLSGIFGLFMERAILRPLVGSPLFTMVIATLGISILLRSMATMIWGSNELHFPMPLTEKSIPILNLNLSTAHILIVLASLLIVIFFTLFFRFAKWGMALRAVAQNQIGSTLTGISVERIFSVSWFLSAAIGALAGMLIAPLTFLKIDMGNLGLMALPAAILGGFESVPGAIVGGLILGIAENLSGLYFPITVKRILPWIVLIFVLLVKPEGIFGEHRKRKL